MNLNTSLINLILIIIFSTLILNLVLNKIAFKFDLVSKPNNRSVHTKKIPFLGGLTIGIILLIIVKILNFHQDFETILIYSSIIILAGTIDDIYNLTPEQKLILIILPISWIVFAENIQLDSLGSYEHIGIISLGKFSPIFTILCIMLFINAFNYIDGIDGLAISNAIIFFIYLNILVRDENLSISLTLITICYIIMLIFNLINFSNVKTFLGDGGSLMTGFLISFFSILGFVKFDIHPTKIIFAIAYPVYDFLTVNFNRMISKKNILEAGKDHLHHILLDKISNNHIKIMIFLNIISIFYLILGLVIINYLGYLFSLIFFILNFILYFFITKKLAK